jgi:multidrug resistance efflux pump
VPLDNTLVVAPFDGVVTQRNIDIGSLVQADATSGTFLFTMMHSDVMRIQLYVPQDQAFGLAPGVEAVVRVPEMPKRSFMGKVTRIADALVVKIKRKSPTPRESFQSLARQSKGSKRLILSTSPPEPGRC